MPSTMIHLLVAHHARPDGEPLYHIGNFAPDAVDVRANITRADKDHLHFRDGNRWEKLGLLAQKTAQNDDFAQGFLLHLFVDALWDEKPLKDYARGHQDDENWFAAYRRETGLAGTYLFHHAAWSKDMWDGMLAVSAISNGRMQDPTDEEIIAYLHRIFAWHTANDEGPSHVFTPAFLGSFAKEAVCLFTTWQQNQAR